jgi:HK97 family phage portal protein
VPTVTRATALITGPLTVAPFRVLEATLGGAPVGSPRWLTDPMLARPDDRFPVTLAPSAVQRVRSVFWAELIRSALWWGVGAFIWQPDSAGQPMAGTMRVVHPGFLHTMRDGSGRLCWQVDTTEGAVTFTPEGTLPEGPGVHITVLRNPLSPIDTEGMSQGVFAMSPGVFTMAGNIDTYQAGQFRAGIPNGYLKTEVPGMTEPQADKLKSKWLANHGSSARRSIAVLNSTTSFVPLSLSPVDAALDQVKRLNVADVAFAFGLDPMTLGAGLNNSATYTNLRDAWENHRDFGLGPWIAAVQDTLSALLPGNQTVTVNLDGFANPAMSERIAAYSAALAAGILTLDEVRALEGLPPLPPPTDNPAPPAGGPTP